MSNLKPSEEKSPNHSNKDVFDTKNVVKTLESLMNRVTQEEVNAENVNAACNCADKIVDILRLHLDVERLKLKSTKHD